MIILDKFYKSSFFEIICVLQMGFATMFIFTGFNTHCLFVTPVLHSIYGRDPTRIDKYAGYYGQSLDYILFSVGIIFAPAMVLYINGKWLLFLGSICFTIYLFSFLYINRIFFYFSSALAGLGFACNFL
ncbi:unnamed protein product [Dracunculus medinensis]|uniref:MFS transporter n=1 Tax=Dracunculus medinensis TaxID=318479 RepID=A0A0N4U6I0_DRAME|nr:unnamed protein product [Dracunculus medinensis]